MSNKVMLSYSDDGGYTRSAEIHKDLVDVDKVYLRRVRLHRGGHSYNRTYRIAYSEDGPFTLISAHARLGVGK